MDFLKLQNFAILGFLAPVVLFYQQSKNLLLKIFRVFWKERRVSYDFAYPMYKFFLDRSIRINFDDYKIDEIIYYHIKQKRYLTTLFKSFHLEVFLYKNFIPVFFMGNDDASVTIRYFKYTLDFENILTHLLQQIHAERINDQKERSNFYIETKRCDFQPHVSQSSPPGYSSTSSTNPMTKTESSHRILQPYMVLNHKIPNMIIGEDVNDILTIEPLTTKNKYIFSQDGLYVLQQVQKWLSSENWYNDRAIRYYRGILLNGNAGTGKSSLVLEVAKKCQIPIFIFDLSSFTNTTFEHTMDGLPQGPGIILFEDIDSMWDKRKNKNRTQQNIGLTFDCFINKLSGVKSVKNKFVFITTNHLDSVDPALLRPGRIDEIIELKSLNIDEKRKMAEIIFDNKIELINQCIDKGKDFSTAEFENLCVQVALQNFWEKKA